MTEKRFKCVSDYDWWGVIDTTGEIKGEYGNEHFSTDTVVDLLNSFDGTIKDLSDDYQRLMGENKELKQLIKKVIDERVVDYPLLCKLKKMVKE